MTYTGPISPGDVFQIAHHDGKRTVGVEEIETRWLGGPATMPELWVRIESLPAGYFSALMPVAAFRDLIVAWVDSARIPVERSADPEPEPYRPRVSTLTISPCVLVDMLTIEGARNETAAIDANGNIRVQFEHDRIDIPEGEITATMRSMRTIGGGRASVLDGFHAVGGDSAQNAEVIARQAEEIARNAEMIARNRAELKQRTEDALKRNAEAIARNPDAAKVWGAQEPTAYVVTRIKASDPVVCPECGDIEPGHKAGCPFSFATPPPRASVTPMAYTPDAHTTATDHTPLHNAIERLRDK